MNDRDHARVIASTDIAREQQNCSTGLGWAGYLPAALLAGAGTVAMAAIKHH